MTDQQDDYVAAGEDAGSETIPSFEQGYRDSGYPPCGGEAKERHYFDEMKNLQREIAILRAEMEKLKRPPLVVGEIMELPHGGSVIVRSSTGPKFVVPVASFVDTSRILPGTMVSMNQNTLAVVGILPDSKDPLIAASEIVEKPRESYAEIGGLDEQIRELRESVELPMKRPDLFRKIGIDPPKGILLAGPPGTGKTLLAKAVAHHTDATFIRIVGSELVQKFIGDGAKRVQDLFKLAKEKAPSIIFIDELDAIGARRTDDGTSGNREVERTLMQLLSELDGFNPVENVKLIAATNRPDILDPAIVRPGRFDRVIQVPSPTAEARAHIFSIHTKRMSLSGDVDISGLAMRCDGTSGADIRAICTEAGMAAIREERTSVNVADFVTAISKIMGGREFGKKQGLALDATMFA
ncbi:MAG: proteasome-activating nucleotidase [Thermoplasmata archaeon HGW-Thermoplasmata-1]|nr:MAG: proteasome-activating nucleotidase [Thermoplasmata archaeon HGW-Thermoplasmata-1]